jgi:hypothetical protein
MRKTALTVLSAAALLVPLPAASADTVSPEQLQSTPQLSAEQRAAIDSFVSGGAVSVGPPSKTLANTAAAASSSRRASYYRGSFLMWTRDNVDFGYDWNSVTWTSAFQQSGSVFPNVARNKGITKYYNTVRNDRFRAANTIGAGIVTPWGDVTVYTSDFIHRLSVNYNGAWSAWSD